MEILDDSPSDGVIIISSDSSSDSNSSSKKPQCINLVDDDDDDEVYFMPKPRKKMVSEVADDLPKIRRKHHHRYSKSWLKHKSNDPVVVKNEDVEDPVERTHSQEEEPPRVPPLPDLPDLLRDTPSDPQYMHKQQNLHTNSCTTKTMIPGNMSRGQPVRKKRKSIDSLKSEYIALVGELFAVSDSDSCPLPSTPKHAKENRSRSNSSEQGSHKSFYSPHGLERKIRSRNWSESSTDNKARSRNSSGNSCSSIGAISERKSKSRYSTDSNENISRSQVWSENSSEISQLSLNASDSSSVLSEHTPLTQNSKKSSCFKNKSSEKKRISRSDNSDQERHRKKMKREIRATHHRDHRSRSKSHKSHSRQRSHSRSKHRHSVKHSRSFLTEGRRSSKPVVNMLDRNVLMQDNSLKLKVGSVEMSDAGSLSDDCSDTSCDSSLRSAEVPTRNSGDVSNNISVNQPNLITAEKGLNDIEHIEVITENLKHVNIEKNITNGVKVDRHFLDVLPGVKDQSERISCDSDSITFDLISVSESSQDEYETKSPTKTTVPTETECLPDIISISSDENNMDQVGDSGVYMKEIESGSLECEDFGSDINDESLNEKDVNGEQSTEAGCGRNNDAFSEDNDTGKVPLKKNIALVKIRERNIFEVLSDAESLPSIGDDVDMEMPVLEKTCPYSENVKTTCRTKKEIPVLKKEENTEGIEIGNHESVMNKSELVSPNVHSVMGINRSYVTMTEVRSPFKDESAALKSEKKTHDVSLEDTEIKRVKLGSLVDTDDCDIFSRHFSVKSVKSAPSLHIKSLSSQTSHSSMPSFISPAKSSTRSSCLFVSAISGSSTMSIEDQVDQLGKYLGEYLKVDNVNPKMGEMPEVCQNIIQGCEEDGFMNIDYANKFLEHFSKKYFMPNKIMRQLMKHTLVKKASKEQHVYFCKRFVSRYPNRCLVKWKHVDICLNMLSAEEGQTETDKACAFIYLQLLIDILKYNLYSKDLSGPREIQRSCAYRLLSAEVGSRNRRKLLLYLEELLIGTGPNMDCGVKDNAGPNMDCVKDNRTADDNETIDDGGDSDIEGYSDDDTDEGIAENEAGDDPLLDAAIVDLPRAIQDLLCLSVDCSVCCIDSANQLARDLMTIYLSLPDLEKKHQLLESMSSQLLKYTLIDLLLTVQYCDTRPVGGFPKSLKAVIESFFKATPMIDPLTSPISLPDVSEMWQGQSAFVTAADVEELAMLLYYVVESYLKCSEEKLNVALKLRNRLTEDDCQIKDTDRSELGKMPSHVTFLEVRLRNLTSELSVNTEDYLLQLSCLVDLG